MATSKVLIIEDDPTLAGVLELYLTKENNEVTVCSDGQKGLELALQNNFDLILLDIMLPSIDGFEVCKEIRKKTATPIIIVSAKTDELDTLLGFGFGADDYITKPFSPRVLVAKTKALLNRVQSSPLPMGQQIQAGSLVVDYPSRNVYLAGQPVNLSSKEFDLLWFLATHPAQVISKEDIFEQVWGTTYGDTSIVPLYIKYLRDKLETTSGSTFLHTIRGKGYKFEAAR